MEVSRGASHVYGIERHTLCLTAVAGDTTSNRFALGTLGVTEPAEIHLVGFDSDEGALQSLVYKHEGGARALASASWDPTQLLVVGRNSNHAIGSPPSVELVELPGISPQEKFPSQKSMLEKSTRRIASLSDASAEPQLSPHEIICHSAAHCRQAATVASTGVGIWKFTQSAPSLVHIISVAQHSMDDIGISAWHPTATTQLSTTDGITVSVSSAQVVTNTDSQDGLSDKGDDEGSDNDDEGIGKSSDGLVAQFDDHETSVYAACWSAADPWLFASLSFDGRMVINTVPQEEKYRILL
ncbi:Protein tssc1 [Coemansia sp. RSA 1365]|nr:Protein tssc1 [Coemansia sp. RSA 1365]